MTQVTPIRDLKGHSEFEQVQKRLIEAGTNPRDKAFISTLGKTGIRISEAIQLKETDIDFNRGTLTIVHLKERLKLKCPNCGEILGKRHLFCPGCGNKVDQALREKVEQRRQWMIPVDRDTLRLLDEYLKWRRKFPYRGPLVFPFTRQRGWQLVEKLGRRVGINGATLAEFNVENVREFIIHEQSREVSPYTVQARVRALKAFSSWLFTEGYTSDNLLARIKLPTAPIKMIEPLTTDEIDKLISVQLRGHKIDQILNSNKG